MSLEEQHSTSTMSGEDRERARAFARADERERQSPPGVPGWHASHEAGERHSMAAHAFATLADNVRDYAIFLIDQTGHITFWGEAARLIKWWSRTEAEGSHLRLLYPSGGAEDGTAEEHIDHASTHGEYSGEGTRLRRDGSSFWAGITLTALRNDDGELLGFAKVTRDLTARRAADALLQSAAATSEGARTAAESASAAKSAFLATMSHELRTPIHAIIGYHQLLELEVQGVLNPDQRRLLGRATDSARHLLQLLTDVLDFTSAEAERGAVARESFLLGDTIAESVAMVENQARDGRVHITDAVSGFAAKLAAHGDPRRVRQILVNLLANAVKFTGGATSTNDDASWGRVTVSAGTALQPPAHAMLKGEGPWIYVRVEDTGSGIPDDQLQKIFEAFVQADMSFTRVHEGVGLGLAISRRLARLMNGDVTVRSEVGLGSTFFLWLPAAPLPFTALEAAAPDDAAVSAATPPSLSTITHIAAALLADLETILQRYVERLRHDPDTPSAHGMASVDIEDSLATFLADMAGSIRVVASALPSGPTHSVQMTAGLSDSTAIQRLICTRHGAQRARLGWQETELRREFVVLREVLTDAVRARVSQQLAAPTAEGQRQEVERGLLALEALLTTAERQSAASFRATGAAQLGES